MKDAKQPPPKHCANCRRTVHYAVVGGSGGYDWHDTCRRCLSCCWCASEPKAEPQQLTLSFD